MFRCKECGCEFDTKPDFCDCGNDEFEEIVSSEKIAEPSTAKTEPENFSEPAKPQPASKTAWMNNASEVGYSGLKPEYRRKSFSEQYPGLSGFLNSLDPISVSIFGLCIILSFVVIFCLWNPPKTDITSPQPSPQEAGAIAQNIPSIDKFWNNTPPVSVKQEENAEQAQVNPIETAANIVKQIIPAPQTAAPKQKPVTPKPVNTVKKTTPAVKTTNTTKTPKKPAAAQTVVTKPAISKPAVTQTKKSANVTQSAQTQPTKQVQTQTTSQPQTAAPKQETKSQTSGTTTVTLQKNPNVSTISQVNTAKAKQEFESYKAGLRNTIGRKIDFTKVVGDGSCTVAFKINSSGKLVNRSFAQQSTNMTLNDAVYAAVMSTPTYNPPPSAYNNETLNLNIKFYNGNFEVSLK